jgi:hypothetical protein
MALRQVKKPLGFRVVSCPSQNKKTCRKMRHVTIAKPLAVMLKKNKLYDNENFDFNHTRTSCDFR